MTLLLTGQDIGGTIKARRTNISSAKLEIGDVMSKQYKAIRILTKSS